MPTLILIVVLFVFALVLPRAARRAAASARTQAMQDAVAVGDEIITAGGLHGDRPRGRRRGRSSSRSRRASSSRSTAARSRPSPRTWPTTTRPDEAELDDADEDAG